MGTNSIKSNLTKDTIISDIKLLLGADILKKDAYIVVEGDDDIKFFRKFCKDNVIIYESFSGKNGVEDIVNSEEIRNSSVIGIRDKDYCRNDKRDRIFFYDRCCLEMMIIGFDESFESIYYEFYNGEIIAEELKKHILTELYKVSIIRKYNEECSKGINFNGLSFSNLIDNEDKLDEERFIEAIKKLNPKKSFDFISDMVDLKSVTLNDLLNITNGHDFISFFKTLCDKTCKNECVNDKQINSVLRGSFNNELLKKTTLYQNINKYFDSRISIWSC